jgi:hypothetical protein
MPNNKNQNRNGGSAQGAREQLQDVGQQFQEGAEQAANRLREGYDTAREGAVQGYRQGLPLGILGRRCSSALGSVSAWASSWSHFSPEKRPGLKSIFLSSSRICPIATSGLPRR